MEKLLNEITRIFKDEGENNLNNAVKDKKLLYLYAYLHYYGADDDYLLDIIENCNYDKSKEDNYAQGVFIDDNIEGKTYEVLIPYYVKDDFDLDDAIHMCKCVEELIYEYQKGNYISQVNILLKEMVDNIDNEDKIVIKLITNYVPEFDEKMKIIKRLDKITHYVSNLSFEFINGEDIENEYISATDLNETSNDFVLDVDDSQNYLKFDDRAIICNISALSLKEKYKKYKNRLLSKNLRFYVPNKKIDDKVVDSIQKKPGNFWFYNNGIIIICDEFTLLDNKIQIKNGSVINGGQTTRLIGDIPFKDDFYISCKVIKSNGATVEENVKFVSEVAEASNTQKPINSIDLVASKPEQRLLKTRLEENDIYMQIKKGEYDPKILKEKYPESYQRTKNDVIAQILYGEIYQHPGTARNSVSTLFSNDKKYNLIFSRANEYDMNLIIDLLKLKVLYKEWVKEEKKDVDITSTKLGLLKNGELFMLASIVLMSKCYFNKDYNDYVAQHNLNDKKGLNVTTQLLFNHPLFDQNLINTNEELFKNRVFKLFQLVYNRYFEHGFNKAQEFKPELAYSNFTKTDVNYYNYLANHIIDDFFGGEINQKVYMIIKDLFYTLTNEDELNNKELLEQAKNTSDKNSQEEETNENDKKLEQALKDYRTKTFKELKIKAYNVMLNVEIKNIVRMKPDTLDNLKSCFISKGNTKTKKFGKEILKIIEPFNDSKKN